MASNQTGKSGGGETTARAKKIMTIFHQLAEVLENTEIITIKEMMSKVLTLSKVRNNAGIFKVCLEFLKILEYRNGIPVHLMKQAIRCFLFIRDDPDVLGKEVSESYMEMVLKDYPSLAMDMELTDEMLKVYFNLLNEGFEESKHIRLMVVGMYKVGKTTLVRRLCKMDASQPPGSTVGIDIFLKSCEVEENKDWIVIHSNDAQPHFHERLQELVTKFPRKTEREPSFELPDTIVEQKSQESIVPSPQEIHKQERRSFDDFQEKIGKRMQADKDYYGKLKDIVRQPKVTKLRPSVTIWDFAGQSVYYSTHHFFLNARSIYLLVLDLSKNLTDEVTEVGSEDFPEMFGNLILENTMEKFTCLDAFKFWMKSIFVYTQQKLKTSQSASERDQYKPTIVLIGTHKDKVTKKHLNGKSYEQYMDSYFNQALESFMNTDVMDLVHPRRFFVQKDGEERDFLEIREEMYNIASKKPFWKEKVPAAFIPLEKIVFEKKTQNQEIMQFGDLVNVNEEAEYKLLEKKEIQLFLKFQHAFGNLIYYDIEGFNEMIILTPQWIINVFKLFVTHKQCMNQKLQGWRDFKKFAKLSPDLIDALLDGAQIRKHKQEIIKYMEHLDVIAKPVIFLNKVDSSSPTISQQTEQRVFTQVCSAGTSVEKEDFYIMPCMLRKRPTEEDLKTYFGCGQITPPTLCIYIKKGFLPPFVFHCILASCIREMPIARVQGKDCLFYGIGTFELTPTRRFTLWSVDNIIHLRVSFISTNEKPEDRIACCMRLKEDLEKLIIKVFSIHGGDYFSADKTELFDYMIKCPHCPSQVPFEKEPENMCNLLSVSNLDLKEEMTCPFCNNLVKAQEVKEYWFSGREVGGSGSSLATDYNAEQAELLLKLPIDAILANLAEEIDEYQNLAQKLQIRERELNKVKLDHPRPITNLVYHILHKWKKKGNCCKILYDAMNDAKCDTRNFFRIIAEEESEEEKKDVEELKSKITHDEYYSLSERQMTKLSKCIGEEYWLFCIRLGLKETEMQQICIDHPKNVAQQVYHALMEWKIRNRPIRELILAMVRSSCEIQEITEVFQ